MITNDVDSSNQHKKIFDLPIRSPSFYNDVVIEMVLPQPRLPDNALRYKQLARLKSTPLHRAHAER